jgi:hypothetical protein
MRKAVNWQSVQLTRQHIWLADMQSARLQNMSTRTGHERHSRLRLQGQQLAFRKRGCASPVPLISLIMASYHSDQHLPRVTFMRLASLCLKFELRCCQTRSPWAS